MPSHSKNFGPQHEAAPIAEVLPYRDSRLPINKRVEDLIGRMTPLEKARQLDLYMGEHFVDRMRSHTMMALDAEFDAARAEALLGDAGVGSIHDLYPPTSRIPNQIQAWLKEHSRLGIPCLFAEEALHGVCSPDHTAFPQAINLASTWDPALIKQIGGAIAAELRSSNVHYTYGPVLDVTRDPRWGRTEETYGEDPYLTARLGVAMVSGLQGDDLTSDHSAIAEPKHFAGHGAPEGGRNTAPVHIGPREMEELMLPPFEAAVKEAGALGIMCAYHELDGIPCSANRELLTGVLREQWGFEGMVLSDLGAIRRLVQNHFTAEDPAAAIRAALTAGVDMQYYDFDHKVFEDSIVSSLESGLLPVEVVDCAVGRVLSLKFRLGLFDAPDIDPALAEKVKRSPKHLAINLQAARESLCLLKNDGAVLPLRKDLKRIAVVGPNAAHVRAGDYSGGGDGKALPLLDSIRSIVSASTTVAYVAGASDSPRGAAPLPAAWLRTASSDAPGLDAELFTNPDLAGAPLVRRIDRNIEFNWVAALPAAGMPVDRFSARWKGAVVASRAATGILSAPAQDAMRVFIDDALVIDSGRDRGPREAAFELQPGRRYSLTVEYVKQGGGSNVVLAWRESSGTPLDAVDAARDADVVIAAIGETPGLSGEGMDRSSLDLPDDQIEMLNAIASAGKPIVAVLMNGRPLTFGRIADRLSAILEAWYPAEFGGQAIAEALFGDVNPSGHLPVTFPKSIGQAPLAYDRRATSNVRYVDQDVEPLYPFGHGLSYTRFEYANLAATPSTTSVPHVNISVDVANAGDRDGEEVVQLYVRDLVASVTRPARALKGFQRIRLAAGERKTVTFALGPDALQLVDRRMKRVVEPGEFEVYVGSSSAATMSTRFTITG